MSVWNCKNAIAGPRIIFTTGVVHGGSQERWRTLQYFRIIIIIPNHLIPSFISFFFIDTLTHTILAGVTIIVQCFIIRGFFYTVYMQIIEGVDLPGCLSHYYKKASLFFIFLYSLPSSTRHCLCSLFECNVSTCFDGSFMIIHPTSIYCDGGGGCSS